MVFAPHPDDETWGCGGTIAKKIREGCEVIVVVMTDGRHAFSKVGIDLDPTPEELKQIRKEEIIRATKILGVPKKNLFFLDFEDRTLEKHEKEAEEKIIEIINKYSPVEIYFPYIKDCHPDHQATNRIIRRCLRKLGLTPLKFQYSIAHKYSRIGPLIDRMFSLFKKDRIEVDISEFAKLKEKATKEYRSEISIISTKQENPLAKNIHKFLKNKEAFYVDK